MSNDRLKAALHQAGLEAEDLAELGEVDVKTARRWLAGRTPRGRYRTRVAEQLGRTEAELWPDEEIQLSGDAREEILAAYPQANDHQAPDWRVLLNQATRHIDLLDNTLLHVLSAPGTVELLARKAAAGCEIRVLIAARDSAQLAIAEAEQGKDIGLTDLPQTASEVDRAIAHIQPLLERPQIEARTYVAGRFNSILRFDDELLLTLHLYGTPGHQAPLLHLRRNKDQGIFEQFAAHYDAIWQDSQPLQPDPDKYGPTDRQPDPLQPPTANP